MSSMQTLFYASTYAKKVYNQNFHQIAAIHIFHTKIKWNTPHKSTCRIRFSIALSFIVSYPQCYHALRQRFAPHHNTIFLTAINKTPHNTAPYCHNTVMPNRSIPMAVSYNRNVRTLPLSPSYRTCCFTPSM